MPPRSFLVLSDAEILKQYNSGKTASSLAAYCSCDDSTIAIRLLEQGAIFHPHGFTQRGKHPPKRTYVLSTPEMAQWYTSGKSTKEIAVPCGCARGTIARRLRKSGVILRSSRLDLTITDTELTRKYQDGQSPAEIAHFCNCSTALIRNRLIDTGIPIRNSSAAQLIPKVQQRHREFALSPLGVATRNVVGVNNPFFGKTHSLDTRIRIKAARATQVLSPESYAKAAESHKKRWQRLTVEQRNEIMRKGWSGRGAPPNIPEQKIGKVLDAFFPSVWRFTGDWKMIIGGLNPDFVDSANHRIIEVFGDYWHGSKKCTSIRQTEEGRIKAFALLGYDTLVIWEHDVKKKTPEELATKISNHFQIG